MADDQMVFAVTARDQATATLRGISGELGRMGGAGTAAAGPMSKLSAVTGGLISPVTLAIGGIGALAAGLMGAVSAAIAEEKGIALLNTSLKQNAKDYTGSTTAIEATIRERQKLAFADDEQRESLGMLVAITKDSSKALDLQRLAMDLARLKGMSLADASTLIGKVYGGNIGILSRYGIQLEAGATSTEALAAIQGMAAGQAEAYGRTTAGSMESMGLAFDDVVEDIGAMLLPVMTDLAIFARDQLIPAFGFIGDKIGWLIGIIADFVGAIGEALGTAGEAIGNFAMDFGEQGDRVHDIADETGNDFQEVKDRIKTYMSEAGMSFEDAALAAEEDFARVGTSLTDAEAVLRQFPKNANTLAKDIGPGIQGGLAEGMPALEGDVNNMVSDLSGIAGMLPEEMAKAMTANQFHLTDKMDELVKLMDEHLSPAEEMAELRGFLASAELAAGYARGDPLLTAQLDQMVADANARLTFLEGLGPGLKLGGDVAKGIESAAPVVASQAYNAVFGAHKVFTDAGWANAAAAGGRSVGYAWIDGVNNAIGGKIGTTVAKVSQVRYILGGSLPTAGPLKGRTAELGGQSIGEAWSKALAKAIDPSPLTGAIRMGGLGGNVMGPYRGMAAVAGGQTFHFNIYGGVDSSERVREMSDAIGLRIRMAGARSFITRS